MGNNFLNVPNGVNIGSRTTDPVSGMKNGDVYFNTTVNKLKVYDGTSWKAVGSGSGSGGGSVNLLALLDKNFDAEANTAGWTVYANTTPADRPESGTGGTSSGNLTLSRTTTVGEVLNGLGSFKLSKAAFNCQGEGYSMDIAVPLGFRGGMYNFSFQVKSSSAYPAGAVVAYLYDVTSSKLLQPTPYRVEVPNGQQDRFTGAVQVDAGCATVRVILHVASNSATAFDLFIDEVSMGPSEKHSEENQIIAAKQKLLVGYTPAANAAIVFDSVAYDTHSAVSGGQVTIPHDGKFRLSGSIQASGTPNIAVYKNGTIAEFVATVPASGQIVAYATELNFLAGDVVDIRIDASVGLLTNSSFSISRVQAITVGPETNVIAAKYSLAANTSVTANTPIPFDVKEIDTAGAFSLGVFTVPVADYYQVAISAQTNSSSQTSVRLYKNGVGNAYIGQTALAGAFATGSHIIYADVGDTLDVRPDATRTYNGTGLSFISVNRVPGPTSLLGPEKIIAVYNGASGSFVNPYNDVIFTNRVKDTHGAYNSTTGEFICPTAGDFNYCAHALIGGTYAVNQAVEFSAVKNLAVVDRNQVRSGGSVGFMNASCNFTFPDCAAGDVLKIQVLNQGSSPAYTSGFDGLTIRKL